MLYSTANFAAIVVLCVGGMIFWGNPRRNVNRAVFASSVNVAAWLACRHLAMTSVDSGLFWLRWTFSVGALSPFTIWLVKESILSDLGGTVWCWFRSSIGWLLVPVVFGVLPFTEAFIPSISTGDNQIRGWAYKFYYAGVLAAYLVIFLDAIRKLGALTGVRKLELQVWLCGGCFVAIMIYGLSGLSALTNDSIYRGMQPIAVLVFYAGTAFAITTNRIFDARQILLVVLEKLTLVLCVSGAVYVLQWVFAAFLSDPFSLLATTSVALWLAASLSSWLDQRFDFFPQGVIARQAAFAAAQRETRVDKLEEAFLALLRGWGQTERAVIVSGSKDHFVGSGIDLGSDSVVASSMRQLRWVTPERISRERQSPERVAVGEFLSAHNLGVLTMCEGPSLNVLIGVGISASRRPFTYPQVTQLLELGSIIQSALVRAHFSAKVQHTEQLATVGLLGASLAHEIRNPLVSIKTFVQLLPTHHQDPAFRQKFFRLIGDEVGRIDQLTEQLLDLASPRTYAAMEIELHPVLRASLDLVAAKAAHKNVQFLTDFQAAPDRAFTDASAAKQVMLNLCFNAIQAVESRESEERWVRVATRNTNSGIEMAVADSGPGIAEEIRPRLFQPFQTTKSTGFGLGLAICSDILANLNASISVDPPEPGHGATFRVTFPCQPLSS